MKTVPWILALGLPLALGWASEAGAADAPRYIQDNARVFSDQAVARAERELERVQRLEHEGLEALRHPLELLVITETRIPVHVEPPAGETWTDDQRDSAEAAARKKLGGWTNRKINAHLVKEARARAEKSGIDGLCVLIILEPRVMVQVPTKGREGFLNFTAREKLRKPFERIWMGRDLAAADKGVEGARGNPDRALEVLVAEFIGLLKNDPGQRPAGIYWILFLILVGAGVGLWAVLGLVLLRLRARDPNGDLIREGAATQRGADPAPALLGSMFGALPALWLYDRLFRPPPGTIPPLPDLDSGAITNRPTLNAPTLSVPPTSGEGMA